MAVSTVISYGVMFRAAYEVPGQTEEVQQKMLKLTLLMPVGTGTVLWKQLEGLKIVSMQVGAFMVVERDSVFEFTDFVIGQLVGLLVSYP